IDAGPDVDKFTQAMGRVLPPTARTIDVWVITGGRRVNVGAAATVLDRFGVGEIVVAQADPWSATERALVQQAQSAGIRVASVNGPVEVDGVRLSLASDGRSWLIQTGRATLAMVAPETNWTSLPAGVDGAIFTGGGPAEWQWPGQGFSVIQVSSNSRDGLPVRAFLQALTGAPIYRTDRVGTVELTSTGGRFGSSP
ncbi:MAG: hypothetical protein M3Z28_13525, partial [Candidatus Dormibacteraeota bacterium]|nr:hypothetical protein [Candidatus Dormibacteraeota bacterium]